MIDWQRRPSLTSALERIAKALGTETPPPEGKEVEEDDDDYEAFIATAAPPTSLPPCFE
jgi:hypothetical protein